MVLECSHHELERSLQTGLPGLSGIHHTLKGGPERDWQRVQTQDRMAGRIQQAILGCLLQEVIPKPWRLGQLCIPRPAIDEGGDESCYLSLMRRHGSAPGKHTRCRNPRQVSRRPSGWASMPSRIASVNAKSTIGSYNPAQSRWRMA